MINECIAIGAAVNCVVRWALIVVKMAVLADAGHAKVEVQMTFRDKPACESSADDAKIALWDNYPRSIIVCHPFDLRETKPRPGKAN